MAAASKFLDTIGINTHAAHATGAYQNTSMTIQALSYLGINTVRDSIRPDGMAAELMDALAAAGIRFDIIVSSDIPQYGQVGLNSFITNLEEFITKYSGSIVAIEGLNEGNIYPFIYNGDSTIKGAAEFQKVLYTAVKSSEILGELPVINLSVGYDDKAVYDLAGDLSDYADFGNSHSYTHTRYNADHTMEFQLGLAQGVTPRDPVMITESGYTTLESIDYLGVSETAHAKLILNNLFNAFENNSQMIYLYELFDGNSSDTVDRESHFGMFRDDGSPKAAATAIHNLTTILSYDDEGTDTPQTALDYTLGNMPTNSHSLVLTKANGAYDLVLWAEPTIWDDINNVDVVNPATTVTVSLGKTHDLIYVYDPLTGLEPIAVYQNVDSIQVPLRDSPLVIEIGARSPVTEAVQTVEAQQTMTSAEFVASIDAFANSSGLEKVTLTDSNELRVSSLSTMKYMLENYQSVLSKIEGGFSFKIFVDSSNWALTKTYDANGTLTSETHDSMIGDQLASSKLVYPDGSSVTEYYAAGKHTQTLEVDKAGVQKTTIFNASGDAAASVYIKYTNGTAQAYDYNITGQAYHTQLQTMNASGRLTKLERSGDNGWEQSYTYSATTGKVVSGYQKSLDGKETFYGFSDGVQKSTYIKYADGTTESYDYNIAGKNYTNQHQTFDKNGKLVLLERMQADGKLTYTELRESTGTVFSIYNKDGKMIEKTTVNKDGAKASYFYAADGTGAYVYKSYDASGKLTKTTVHTASNQDTTTTYSDGVKTSLFIKYPDGSSESYDYSISGKAYHTQHQIMSANGKVIKLERIGDNGWEQTYTYSATTGKVLTGFQQGTDGKKTFYTYDEGVQQSTKIVYANGSNELYNYNITGKDYVTQHQVFDADGKLTSLVRTHSDGSRAYSETHTATSSVYTTHNDVGAVIERTTVNANGSKASYAYAADGTGAYVYKSYSADGNITKSIVHTANNEDTTTSYVNGIKSGVYIKHADGTAESFDYSTTGTFNLTKHQTFGADGKVTALERYNADGSLSYAETRSDGVTKYDIYDSKGTLKEETTVKADGFKESFFFSDNATTTHQMLDKSGKLVFRNVEAENGTHNATAYTYGVTLEGGANDDLFTFRPNSSGTVIYTGGHDKITGFEANAADGYHDQIKISSVFASSIADLKITQLKNDTVITFDDDNSIVLTNTTASSLVNDYLLFA